MEGSQRKQSMEFHESPSLLSPAQSRSVNAVMAGTLCTSKQLPLHVCECTCKRAHTHTHTHTHTRTHTHAHTHAHTHTHKHTYTHNRTYTHAHNHTHATHTTCPLLFAGVHPFSIRWVWALCVEGCYDEAHG